MKPDEMRVAIAEKCGWEVRAYGWCKNGTMACTIYELPYYCNDLNAMHEALQTLDETEHFQYRLLLNQVLMIVPNQDWARCYVDATAAQRAEAFCRVFWPEKFNS